MFLNAAFRVSAFRVSAFRVSCVLRFRCVSCFVFHCVSRSAFVHFAAFWRFAFRCISRVLRFRAYALKAVSTLSLSRLVCVSVAFTAFRSVSRFGVLRFAAFGVSAFCVSVFCVSCVSQAAFQNAAFQLRFAFRTCSQVGVSRFAFQNALSYSEKAAFQKVRFAFQCFLIRF